MCCSRSWAVFLVSLLSLLLLLSPSACVAQWLSPATYQAFMPRAVAVDSASNLWVADTASRSLLQLSPAGQLLQQVVPEYGADYPSFFPTAICVDSFGQVYVLDTAYNSVCQLAGNGSLLAYAAAANPISVYGSYGLALSPQQPSPPSVSLYTACFYGSNGGAVQRLSMAGRESAVNLSSNSMGISVAVNSASVVHVLVLSSPSIARIAANGTLLPSLLAPDWNSTIVYTELPASIAIDPADDSIVLLLYDQTVQRLSSAGLLLSSFSVPSGAPFMGQGMNPRTGIAIAPDSSIFTAGAQLNSVSQFSSDGQLLASFNLSRPVWQLPFGLALDPISGDILVVDGYTATVVRLSAATGAQLSSFPVCDPASCQPYAVTCDSQGNIYVSVNTRPVSLLYKFSSAGIQLLTFGATLAPPLRLVEAFGLWVNPNTGSLWATDQSNQRLLEFSSTNSSLLSIVDCSALGVSSLQAAQLGPDGSSVFLLDADLGLLQVSAEGRLLQQYNMSSLGQRPWYLSGIAVDSSGNLWLSDYRPALQVVCIAPNGSVLVTLRAPDRAYVPGAGFPTAVALGQDGSVYATDGYYAQLVAWRASSPPPPPAAKSSSSSSSSASTSASSSTANGSGSISASASSSSSTSASLSSSSTSSLLSSALSSSSSAPSRAGSGSSSSSSSLLSSASSSLQSAPFATSSVSPEPSGSGGSASSTLSNGAVIGIAIGGAVVGLLLCVTLLLLLLKWRRRSKSSDNDDRQTWRSELSGFRQHSDEPTHDTEMANTRY
jgi:hypothetical protein